jgi:uncharacterized protein (DUF58 family)
VSSKALHLKAEQLAAGLPPLLLRARRLAASVSAGAHGRRRPGSGDEFWQFRHSVPGDPASAIDWRQSAKSDHLYIRESEWTVAQTTRVWVDPSASMRWRSGPDLEQKFERALLLAVAVAILLEQAGERIGLLDRPGPAFYGRTAPTRLALALLAAAPSGDWPVGGRHPGPVLLMSDFLLPLEQLAEHMRRWSALGLSGHFLQILDPAEQDLAYAGRVRLRGLEQEGHVLLDRAESLRGAYAEQSARHQSGVAAIARQAGWRYERHLTSQPARVALTHLHAALGRG